MHQSGAHTLPGPSYTSMYTHLVHSAPACASHPSRGPHMFIYISTWCTVPAAPTLSGASRYSYKHLVHSSCGPHSCRVLRYLYKHLVHSSCCPSLPGAIIYLYNYWAHSACGPHPCSPSYIYITTWHTVHQPADPTLAGPSYIY